MKKDLSVIIPCHNEGHFLLDCVNSIFSQDWLPCHFEVILILDDINDITSKVVDQICKRFTVKITQNNYCAGSATSRNIGVNISSGEWIAFLDGDDFWPKNSVMHRFNAVNRFPHCNWICGDFKRIDEAGIVTSSSWYLNRLPSLQPYRLAYENNQPFEFKDPFHLILMGGMPWTGSVMVRRRAFFATGGFDKRFKQGQDNHLWLRLARNYSVVFTPKVLAFYRNRRKSITKTRVIPNEWNRKVYSAILSDDKFNIYKTALKRHLSKLYIRDIEYCRRYELWKKAIHLNLEAFKNTPVNFSVWRQFIGLLSDLCFFKKGI